MTIKALLLDFDGTLVTKDMLSEAIGLVGKKAESEQLDHQFLSGKLPGQEGLIARINLLKGVPVSLVQEMVRKDLSLVPGALELLNFCHEHRIISILASGSITPILEVYEQELGIDYLVGSNPTITNHIIEGIVSSAYPKSGNFKVVGISEILAELHISNSECVAIGDGRGDLPMFELAGMSIAINPKGGIEQFANYTVSDLHEVKEIIAGKISA